LFCSNEEQVFENTPSSLFKVPVIFYFYFYCTLLGQLDAGVKKSPEGS
jgi:hypothetical protein